MTPDTKEPVRFTTIEAERGDTLFRRPGPRWGGVVNALLVGDTVFVTGITRAGLETLRQMLRSQTSKRLRSRTVTENDEAGYLLQLVSHR